jgi:Flp pilus assembly protein TadD
MANDKFRSSNRPSDRPILRHLRLPLALLIFAAVFYILDAVFVLTRPVPPPVTTPLPPTAIDAHAGSAACARCHRSEYDAWKSSHHGLAQIPAGPAMPADGFKIPPGRTDDGGRPMVDADGPGVRSRPWPVTAAIGLDPLIQYLVEFDRGRLQPTALAWDVHKKEWFDLHAAEDRRPDEWGHWTNRGMTWNLQCAYCHMTDFRKGYDAASDAYASRWIEPSVGCESCHGPMREHAARWEAQGAAAREAPRPQPPPGLASLDAAAAARAIETCAPCHARRQQLAEGFAPHPAGAPAGETFLDYFDPELPDSPAFYPDGQVRDEDYEWASFAQSLMHAKGVSCGNCHDPHSGKTRLGGNALCLQCHKPELDSPSHTFHKPGTPGAACVDCHMPLTTYMLRHPRRDHSFSKPLPELTVSLGIPNACTRCHADRDAAWAVEQFNKWYGRKERPAAARAALIAAGREGRPESVAGLAALLGDAAAPPVWRASAAALLARWAGRDDAGAALRRALADPSPLVRARAARAFDNVAPSPDSPLVPLLRDPVRLVRVSAAWALKDLPAEALREQDADPFRRAYAELRDAALFNADHPAGRLQLGVLAEHRNDAATAEREYRAALRLDPRASAVRCNLAVLLSRNRLTREAVPLLEEGVRLSPTEPALHFNLGLARADTGRPADAVKALEEAIRLDPRFPRAHRNLGLLYMEMNRPADAHRVLAEAARLDPDDREVRELLERLVGRQPR